MSNVVKNKIQNPGTKIQMEEEIGIIRFGFWILGFDFFSVLI
jgi:hypothetical protein